jgi:hypothetical protein
MNKTKIATIAGTLAAAAAMAVTLAPAGSAAPSSTAAVSATYFAKVDTYGAFLASSGIVRVWHTGIGRYQLDAVTNVANCALTGTVNGNDQNDAGSGSQSIFLNEVQGSVFVRTSTPGAPGSRSVDDDRAFSVVIVC